MLLQEGSGEVNFSPGHGDARGGVELRILGTEEVLATLDDARGRRPVAVPAGAAGILSGRAELCDGSSEAAGEALELVIGEQRKNVRAATTGRPRSVPHRHVHRGDPQRAASTRSSLRPAAHPAGDWLVAEDGAACSGRRNAPPAARRD